MKMVRRWWSDSEYILKVEKVADGLDMGCQEQEKSLDNSEILAGHMVKTRGGAYLKERWHTRYLALEC